MSAPVKLGPRHLVAEQDNPGSMFKSKFRNEMHLKSHTAVMPSVSKLSEHLQPVHYLVLYFFIWSIWNKNMLQPILYPSLYHGSNLYIFSFILYF
jgi:hypothetical protein